MKKIAKFLGIGATVAVFSAGFVAINQMDKDSFTKEGFQHAKANIQDNVQHTSQKVASLNQEELKQATQEIKEKTITSVNSGTYTAGMIATSFGNYLKNVSKSNIGQEILDEAKSNGDKDHPGHVNVEEVNARNKARVEAAEKQHAKESHKNNDVQINNPFADFHPNKNKEQQNKEVNREINKTSSHNTQPNHEQTHHAAYDEAGIEKAINDRLNKEAKSSQEVGNRMQNIRSKAYDYDGNDAGLVTTSKLKQ